MTGLKKFSNYTVTMVAINTAGRSERSSKTVATMATGSYFSTTSINTD